jgi:hypothetical protein
MQKYIIGIICFFVFASVTIVFLFSQNEKNKIKTDFNVKKTLENGVNQVENKSKTNLNADVTKEGGISIFFSENIFFDGEKANIIDENKINNFLEKIGYVEQKIESLEVVAINIMPERAYEKGSDVQMSKEKADEIIDKVDKNKFDIAEVKRGSLSGYSTINVSFNKPILVRDIRQRFNEISAANIFDEKFMLVNLQYKDQKNFFPDIRTFKLKVKTGSEDEVEKKIYSMKSPLVEIVTPIVPVTVDI